MQDIGLHEIYGLQNSPRGGGGGKPYPASGLQHLFFSLMNRALSLEAKIKAMFEDEVKYVKEKKTDQLIEKDDRLDSMVFENSEIVDIIENVEKKLKKERTKTREYQH